MSLKIEIFLPDEGEVSRAVLARHMDTLGFVEPYRMPSAPGFPERTIPGDTQGNAGANAAPAEAPAETPKATRSRKKADDKPAISTNPEDRRPPEDDAETQAQDAADEQAEVEAAREPEKAITVDDLRGVMGEYVQKFEMAATQEDGPLIFADALGKPPAGEAAWKLSLLAELPQERLKAAYDGWKAAVAGSARYQKRG